MKFKLLKRYETVHTMVLRSTRNHKNAGRSMSGSELIAVAAALETEWAAQEHLAEYGEDTVEFEMLQSEAITASDWAVTVLNATSSFTREGALSIIAQVEDYVRTDLDERVPNWERTLGEFFNMHSGG